jgi:hypothetical protein
MDVRHSLIAEFRPAAVILKHVPDDGTLPRYIIIPMTVGGMTKRRHEVRYIEHVPP